MKFDKLKPGMFLYNKQKNITSWLVIKRKSSDTVMVDDYWRNTLGNFYRDDSEINEYEWNSGNIYRVCEPATPEQAQGLIVAIFEKG